MTQKILPRPYVYEAMQPEAQKFFRPKQRQRRQHPGKDRIRNSGKEYGHVVTM
mgnify:FL=1